MATAVISVASSVVGGLLVLAGQWLIQRSNGRRHVLLARAGNTDLGSGARESHLQSR
jgi:hypothetical protein